MRCNMKKYFLNDTQDMNNLMLYKKLCLALILTLSYSTLCRAQTFVGYAHDLESKELLYTEHHQYQDDITHTVIYKEIDGRTFAEKSISYAQGFISPSIEQKNSRNGEIIKIVKRENVLFIEYKENDKEDLESEELNLTSSLVVDAGFDHFISQNWIDLTEGRSLTVDYLVPSLLDSYQLTIEKYECENDENYCFSISASNFFISMFSDQLRLSYDKISRKLTSFQGRSNICDEEGEYQDVLISYDYSHSQTQSNFKPQEEVR